MLFNSSVFLFAFLPVSIVVFFSVGRYFGAKAALAWLSIASFFFYLWWKPSDIILLLFSIVINFIIGRKLCRVSSQKKSTRNILIAGLVFNLALLSWFKYANLFAHTLDVLFSLHINLKEIPLPLAISFFTFNQIAFLVDCSQGKVNESSFLNYSLFVNFYPHLIAGPIVHHKEMMPQFEKLRCRFSVDDMSIGLTWFTLGLLEKSLVADSLAAIANPVFAAAGRGMHVSFIEAWFGALAYALQIYYDFAGYSNMAIGLARMFGIHFPLNFNSPYRAVNIADFWRRWHMTLSRFLRDYLYIPLGGSRHGTLKRYRNLLITMLLGGLWHGAAWTFVLWGGVHGLLLVMHQMWKSFLENKPPLSATMETTLFRVLSRAVTILCVTLCWVLFRADSWNEAMTVYHGMAGLSGIVGAQAGHGMAGYIKSALFVPSLLYQVPVLAMLAIAAALLWSIWGPNVQEIMGDVTVESEYSPLFSRLLWTHSLRSALCCGVLLFIALHAALAGPPSPFLYFHF